MSKVFAFFADGMEEAEGIIVVDMLRRAGIQVTVVSVMDSLTVTSSHKIQITCDATLDQVDFTQADLLFLPGGKVGTDNLRSCKKLEEQILAFHSQGKRLAAVCAAPSVYGRLGLLKGRRATCYPGFEQYLEGAQYTGGRVETDGNLTTSKGMGTCIDLGHEIISLLEDKEKADKVCKEIMYLS